LALAMLAAAPPRASAETSTGPPPVVVDTDMDFDDTAALAYLAEADRLGLIDLRALAVEISGVAFPGNGLSHAHCLLDKLGLPRVPVSDGDRTRTNNFPDWARTILDGIVESGLRTDPATPCPAVAGDGHAADLLQSSIRSAPGEVTLITLGPLTNVAEALERDPALATRIGRVFLMGGRLDWSGFPTSGIDTHDYNLWVDAPAAQAVLKALPARIFMTGHEATDFVPLTEALRQRLAADRTTPAADTVFVMASNPLLVGAEAENQGGAFWWDPLDAAGATFGGIVSYRPNHISVVQGGEDEGRTFVDPDGSLVHYGISARTGRFEQTFLDILNARYPEER
jgi:purine nucleosidase